MKVKDLNGRTYTWPPNGYQIARDDIRPRSEYHLRCRSLLHSLYPTQPILEEVPLPSEQLFIDFYLPNRKIAVEVHGEQHYQYVQHFHKNPIGFAQAKARDERKRQWCIINNIVLIELPYMENDDEWRNRIENIE